MKKMISKQIFFSFLALAFARGEAETLKGAVKCGPPSLHTDWANVTSVAGGKAILTCPLDTVNSCLVDLVEWYKRDSDPRVGPAARRKLLRDVDRVKVFAFDPLMIYLERVRPEDGGWFTCVVGNSDGRSEASTYLEVRPENAYVGQPEKPSAPLKNILLSIQPAPVTAPATTTSAPATTTTAATTTAATTTTTVALPVFEETMRSSDASPEATIETASRRNLTPEMIAELQQMMAKSPQVYYGSSRYSYSAGGGSSGYAPWYDRSYYDSSRSTPSALTRTTTERALPRSTTETSTTRADDRLEQARKDDASRTNLDHSRGQFRQSNQEQRKVLTEYQTRTFDVPSTVSPPMPKPAVVTSSASVNNVNDGNEARNRLHLDAINDHLRYIYERLDDVIARIEKLERVERI